MRCVETAAFLAHGPITVFLPPLSVSRRSAISLIALAGGMR
jgi:hypothetical protein